MEIYTPSFLCFHLNHKYIYIGVQTKIVSHIDNLLHETSESLLPRKKELFNVPTQKTLLLL